MVDPQHTEAGSVASIVAVGTALAAALARLAWVLRGRRHKEATPEKELEALRGELNTLKEAVAGVARAQAEREVLGTRFLLTEAAVNLLTASVGKLDARLERHEDQSDSQRDSILEKVNAMLQTARAEGREAADRAEERTDRTLGRIYQELSLIREHMAKRA